MPPERADNLIGIVGLATMLFSGSPELSAIATDIERGIEVAESAVVATVEAPATPEPVEADTKHVPAMAVPSGECVPAAGRAHPSPVGEPHSVWIAANWNIRANASAEDDCVLSVVPASGYYSVQKTSDPEWLFIWDKNDGNSVGFINAAAVVS